MARSAVNLSRAAKTSRVIDLYPLARPILHRLDPETAHELTLRALVAGVRVPVERVRRPELRGTFLGRELAHPLGLAAGFDKNARAVPALFALDFSFVEVGGVTPLPQTGNPRPRVFRLPHARAVINRMGFPNHGGERVAARLERGRPPGLLGVNIASNAASVDPQADFVALARRFAPLCDYLALDISCPNTENGQLFLDPARLEELLAALREADLGATRPKLVAKLSPDVADDRLRAIVAVLDAARIDAICVGNTTLARPEGLGPVGGERGGLSGAPLFAPSLAMLRRIRALVGGRVPLVGTGGVASGAEAYAKIRAGASVLQIYTALIYRGPAVVAEILRDLARALAADGFATLAEAVGVDAA